MTTHVFWPDGPARRSSGTLVGWKREGVVCVAAVASQGAHLPDSVQVVGRLHDGQDGKRAGSSSELVVALGNNIPRVLSPAGAVVVLYSRPSVKRHHFLALEPLLASLAPLDEAERNDLEHRKLLADTMRGLTPAMGGSDAMESVIGWINGSQEVSDLVDGRGIKKPPGASAASSETDETFQAPTLALRSALASQTLVRLRQVARWPRRYRSIWRENAGTVASRRAAYVRLFNTVWLIANDACVGYSVSAFIRLHSEPLARALVGALEVWAVQKPIELLRWTNSYPAGLKLNDELGRAVCEGSTRAIQAWWNYIFSPLAPALPYAIHFVGIASALGATFALAASADLLSLCTVHLWLLYRVGTFTFRWHCHLLGVLFDIFRGQKWNALRDRREPATYEMDQLVLGTIFFTLATFLFPTVLAFYILIAASRVVIIAIHASIETALALLNHFPLFAVLLRIKDPARIPAGVRLLPVSKARPDVLRLESVPVGLTWIFSDYVSAWGKLTAHYSPAHLVPQLLTGVAMDPLARHHIGDA